ncbi:MAG: tyrosine-type recombinase/integrase [Aureispira sp.]
MHFHLLLPEFKHYCLREKGIQPKSYRTIISHVQRLLSSSNVQTLRSLKTPHVKEYLYTQSYQYDWQPKTFRNHLQSINTFCRWAKEKGYLLHHPAKRIKKPKLPKPLPRYLTQQEATLILQEARKPQGRSAFISARDYTIIATFLQTGVRLNELRHLKYSDIDLEGRTIKVEKGKGSKMRLIPLHFNLLPILNNYLTIRKKNYSTALWLFPSCRQNTQLSNKYIHQWCRQLSLASGVKFTPHMLRHTFGRQCTDQNFPFFKLKEIMGHSSVATTQRYASVSVKGLQESFSQIDLIWSH